MFSKAPWSSGPNNENRDKDNKEEEQSLTTILTTHDDRSSLLLLIAGCAESMRKTITDTFDPNITGQSTSEEEMAQDKDSEATAVKVDELDLVNLGDDVSNLPAASDADAAIAEAKARQEAEDRAKRDYEHRIKELSSAKMIDLKLAALEYFDDWRDRVLERVGEAVNQKEAVLEEVGKPDPKQPSIQTKSVNQHTEDEQANTALKELYPPRDTPFTKFDEPKRMLVLHSLLLLMLSLKGYPSQSRILLLYIASSLNLKIENLADDESKVAQGLLEMQKQMNADSEMKKKQDENSTSRKWKMGLGAVGGAVLIGVTGGLAAPLLAAGLGTVMGGIGLGGTITATYLGALAGSAPLVGALFGTYGGLQSAKMMDAYAREVEDFAFIPVHKSSALSIKSEKNNKRLRVAIGITGYLNTERDVVQPWNVISSQRLEAFALRYELIALMDLGNAIVTYMKSAAWGFAKNEIIRHTVFAALTAGLWPLAIVQVSKIVDNPFSVARSRSEKAGRVLADALINKVQGERPITLVGYSLGSRVIYSCLEELANRKAFGLVESVVLAGAAVPADSVVWRRMRSVVAGRVINVYSTNDYLLGFLYRTSSLQYGIAGLQAIGGVSGVENVDVSELVDGHTKYRYLTGRILKKIGFEDIDEMAVEAEEKKLQEEERKAEEERKKKETNAQGKQKSANDQERDMNEEIAQRNEAGTMSWISDKLSKMDFTKNKAEETTKDEPQDFGKSERNDAIENGSKNSSTMGWLTEKFTADNSFPEGAQTTPQMTEARTEDSKSHMPLVDTSIEGRSTTARRNSRPPRSTSLALASKTSPEPSKPEEIVVQEGPISMEDNE